MSVSYPKRPSHFAMKFCRQLSKSAAAMRIGADGCWLLTVVVMQEDAGRYEVAPEYYDIALADRCGWHRTKVDRVRQKCIDAGYLHYEPGPHRGASKYWVILPTRTLPDDEPTSHGATQDATQSATSTAPQMHANCTSNAPEMRTARDTYIPDPVPDPVPKEKETPPPADASSKKNSYSAEFEEAWLAFKPSRRGGTEKPESFTQWKRAIRSIGSRDGDEPHLWLLSRIQSYARSPAGQSKYSPAMPRWLKHGRYDDDEAKWQRADDDEQSRTGLARVTAGDHNRDEAAKALEILNAARRRNANGPSVGLPRLPWDQDEGGGDASVD